MADQIGKYQGEISGLVVTKSKSGSPQVELKCDVFDVFTDGQFIPMNNPIERTIYLSLKGGAEKISFDQLEKIGFNGSFQSPEIANQSQIFDCYEESYKDKTYTKWRLDLGRPESEPADIGTVKKAEARWRNSRQQRTFPQGNTSPGGGPPAQQQGTAPTAEVQSSDDDDVPF